LLSRHLRKGERLRSAVSPYPQRGPGLNETPLDTEHENSIHKCLMFKEEQTERRRQPLVRC
jgi:hypothetical protein